MTVEDLRAALSELPGQAQVVIEAHDHDPFRVIARGAYIRDDGNDDPLRRTDFFVLKAEGVR